MRSRLKDRFAGKDPTPKEDAKETKDEPKAKPKAEVKAEPKPEETEEKKTKVSVTKPQRSADDDLVKATRAASDAAKEAIELVKQTRAERSAPPKETKEPTEAEDKLAGLPEKYKSRIPAIQALEKKFPEKYKGLLKRYVDNSAATERYAKKWERDNPGQSFDSTSEEHNEFFANHDVTWDTEDYHRAVASAETESILAEERKKHDESIRQLKAENAARSIEPVIRQQQGKALRAVLKEAAPEIADLYTEDARLDNDVLKAKLEENPFIVQAALQEVQDLIPFIDQTERLFHPDQLFPFDDKNPVHMQIYDFAREQEEYIKSLPEDKQRDNNGRMFSKKEDWLRMDQAQQGRHWVLDQQTLIHLKRLVTTHKLKERVAQIESGIEKVATRKGFKKEDAPKVTGEEKTEKPPKKEPVTEKPVSPTMNGDSKVDTLGKQVTNNDLDFKSRLKARFAAPSIK